MINLDLQILERFLQLRQEKQCDTLFFAISLIECEDNNAEVKYWDYDSKQHTENRQ